MIRGGREVLPAIDCAVEKGKVTGLLGPSGAGKTTLIRAIVGVQVIAGGEVRVLGEPAGSAELRGVGAVVAVVAGASLLALFLGALTLRRRTP